MVEGVDAGEQEKAETGRDRVRRLFIDPLRRDGMRFKHRTPEDERGRRLDQMADDLGYLSDQELVALRICMRTKGEGSGRDFWPPRVRVLFYAETARPRPLEELPGLKSWFVSVAGSQAAAVPGRLVAEYEFWTKRKHPPTGAQFQDQIARRAAELTAKYEKIAERCGRGVADGLERAAWERFAATEKKLRGWIEQKRGEAA